MVTLDQIKQLREETAVSISECKKALEEAGGDFNKAKEVLRKMGRDLANKRTDKEATSGIIHSYIHPNKKIGVMMEIRCESDFAANSDDLKNLAHELCLHIAAFRGEEELMQQAWIKDTSKTIKDLFDEYSAKIGENIIFKNITRYEI